jgi:endonuclease YncB( thermonuclease family)
MWASTLASLDFKVRRMDYCSYRNLCIAGIVLGVCFRVAHADTFEGAVVRVVDGDSLIVRFNKQQIRVRLKEIDAPEIKQAFGKDSRQSLEQMCATKTVKVLWTEKDRNGRTLGRVWCAGIDANAEQVRRGMAWVFDRYVRDRSLYSLQDAARLGRLGLWADSAPIPPWRWRQAKGVLEYKATK